MQQNDRTYIENVIQQIEGGTSQLKTLLADDQLQAPCKRVIERMIKARDFAKSYLQNLLDQPDEASNTEDHAFGSILHKMYPDMLNNLPTSVDPTTFDRLQDIETETHRAMHEALQHVSSHFLKSVLIDLNPRLNRSTAHSARKKRAC